MLCMLPPDRLRKQLELMLHHINLLWGFCVLLLLRGITSLANKNISFCNKDHFQSLSCCRALILSIFFLTVKVYFVKTYDLCLMEEEPVRTLMIVQILLY